MNSTVRGLAAILAIASLGAVATGARAQAEPAAAASTLPSGLAFVDPGGRLAWLPAGAERARTLLSPRGRHAFPVWSPDGRRLAAIVRDASGARAVVLDLGDAEEAGRSQPAEDAWYDEPDEPVIYLDWADDGGSLLLLVADAESGFRLVRASRNERRTLARGAPLYWDQRPDGGVVVHAGGPDGSRLTIVDAAGRETGELPRPGAFRSPAVSQSGDWLAYGSEEPGGVRRVVVVRAPAPDESGPAESTPGDPDARRALGHRGLAAFAWHPTRDLLALTRPLSDVPHSFGPLGGLDAASGAFEPWIDEPVVAFWWSPGGRRIAVLAVDTPAGDTVAGSEPAAWATVLASARGAGSPAPARPRSVQGDGARFRLGMLEVESGETRWLAKVTPSRTFLSQELPFFDQYARSHARWSPDGTRLALPVRNAAGREAVWIVEVETGTLHEAATGAMPSWRPSRPASPPGQPSSDD